MGHAKGWVIMRIAKRRNENVLDMKLLKSLARGTRIDRVRNEEVRGRCGIERDFASRVNERMLRWCGYMEGMYEHRMARGV